MRDRIRITHANFYKLCDEMRKQKAFLLEQKMSREEFVKWLTTRTGINVSVTSVADLKDATQIHWTANKGNGDNFKGKSAVIAENVRLIAKELNVTLTESFYETFGR